MNIPIRIDIDVYCRARSKLLLSYDEKLYLGYTPDGKNPGRTYAAQVSVIDGGKSVPYTCAIQENKVIVQAGNGYLEFAMNDSDEIIFSGKDLGVMISNGKAANTFMGGGNAIVDARGGGLFAIAGVKMRFLPRKGSVKPESRWDFNYLCDPDPKLYLIPEKTGEIEFAVFASGVEENVTDPGTTVDQAAATLAEAFEAYCKTMQINPENVVASRAAWTLWNCIQPDMRAYELNLTIKPTIVRGRQDSGALFAEDYALYALIIPEPQDAAQVMLQPFVGIQPDGFLPSELSNHKLQYTCTAPLYGLVLQARRDIAEQIGLKEYYLLKRALTWWRNRRYCDRHNLFYYVHRTENGMKAKIPVIGLEPVMTPELNSYMLLWIRQMESLAIRWSLAEDASQWKRLAAQVWDGMRTYLSDGTGYHCVNVLDVKAKKNTDGDCLPALLNIDGISEMNTFDWPDTMEYAAEFLALAGCTEPGERMARKILASAGNEPIPNVRSAVTCLLASGILSERRR